jgi:two-component sensor histidine kinase
MLASLARCFKAAQLLPGYFAGEGDDVKVPTTWIQPIGMLVNELVTNAAKHGAGPI